MFLFLHFGQRISSCAFSLLAIFGFAFQGLPTFALDNANPLELTTVGGWQAFELATQGDALGPLADAGYGATITRGRFDGLGTYQSGNSISIFLNHESSTVAAISRVDVNMSDMQTAVQSKLDGGTTPFPASIVTGVGYAYDTIYDGTYHAVSNSAPVASGSAAVGTYSDANFSRFCSGTSHLIDTFGLGRGLVDELYITGEEVSGGKLYALDSATQALWEIPDAGLGSWENAALVDTGNTTHIAMLLNSDVSSAPGDYLQLYVGEKGVDVNGDLEIDVLERNGLRGGTVYYFDPDGGASTTDLPDGLVTGTWSTSTAGALQETKLEDLHTNPLDGTQVVFAAENDGIYIMDLDLQFSGGAFSTGLSTVSIQQIDDDDTPPIESPDNIVWSENGKIYVQEDGTGDGFFYLNADGTGVTQFAQGLSEPSGIVDISSLLDYEPGSVFLSSLQGNGLSGGQLTVLVSDTATALNSQAPVPEPNTYMLLFCGLIGLAGIRRLR